MLKEFRFSNFGSFRDEAVLSMEAVGLKELKDVPRKDGSDKDYVSNKVFAYMWVKGSENADCVKAWFDCNRTVNYDEIYVNTAKEKYLANNQTEWSVFVYKNPKRSE